MGKKLFLISLIFLFSSFSFAIDIHDAVIAGDAQRVKTLIMIGPSLINARDEYKNTALHYAVYYEYLEIAQLLLQNQANPNIKDQLDMTPLQFAEINQDHAMVDLLKNYGAGAKDLPNAFSRTSTKPPDNCSTLFLDS